MKTDQTRTFCLLPESIEEYQQWESLLEPYCWAQGEFGMVLTEAAFREIKNKSANDATISQTLRNLMITVAETVEAGDYADVCLQRAATLVGDSSSKRMS